MKRSSLSEGKKRPPGADDVIEQRSSLKKADRRGMHEGHQRHDISAQRQEEEEEVPTEIPIKNINYGQRS